MGGKGGNCQKCFLFPPLSIKSHCRANSFPAEQITFQKRLDVANQPCVFIALRGKSCPKQISKLAESHIKENHKLFITDNCLI